MLRQIPLIELELGLTLLKPVENNSDGEEGMRNGLKRGRVEEEGHKRTHQHDYVEDEPASKRLKHDDSSHHETSSPDAGSERRSAAARESENSRPKALRYSARIRARESQSRRAISASLDAVKSAHQFPGDEASQEGPTKRGRSV